MQRIAALVLALLMLAPSCLAEPATPYPADTMLYYPQLTAHQQQLFDLIYHVVLRGLERIELPADTRYEDALAAMEAVLADCPELCALSGEGYTIRYPLNSPELATAIIPCYCMEASRQSELIQAAREMAAGAQGDDFAREWYLHDLLCRRAAYDDTAPARHSAWGALMEGRAVCDGYARAMTLLCRLAGIRCGMVTGETLTPAGSLPHAWNMLCIDNAWTQLDVTLDDQGQENIITYFYFNLTDVQMAADHTQDSALALPPCTQDTALWHARRSALVRSPEDIAPQMMNGLRSLALGADSFSLRLVREADYLALVSELDMWVASYGASCLPGEALTGRVQAYLCPAQQCVAMCLK